MRTRAASSPPPCRWQPSCWRADAHRLQPPGGSATSGDSGTITAIGAENEYASVIGQVGGKYVHAEAIMSNPDTDPHTFEASPSVAREISQADSSCRTASATTTGSPVSRRRPPIPAARSSTCSTCSACQIPRRTRTCGTTGHHARRGHRHRQRPRRDRARARGLLQGKRGQIHRQSRPVEPGPRPVQDQATRTPRWRPPNRWPTTCCRPRARTT